MKKKSFTPKHTYCESAVDCTAQFRWLINCLANFFQKEKKKKKLFSHCRIDQIKSFLYYNIRKTIL